MRVPEIPYKSLERRDGSAAYSGSDLPCNILDEKTDVDRIFSSWTEVTDEPFFGLQVNGNIKSTDTLLTESAFEFRHKSSLNGVLSDCQAGLG